MVESNLPTRSGKVFFFRIEVLKILIANVYYCNLNDRDIWFILSFLIQLAFAYNSWFDYEI